MRYETTQAMLRFAGLLEAVCPRYRMGRQPFTLEADAPRSLAAFFEAVGFSDAIGAGGPKPQTWRPTREASREWMRQAFQEWFSGSVEARDAWGVERDDFSAAWKRLPSAFRILQTDSRIPLITDESSSAEDPPLLELKLATAELLPRPERATERLIRATWTRVMSQRAASAVNLPMEGQAVLEPVFAGLSSLAEGIWGLMPPLGTTPAEDEVLVHLFYDSFERYIAYVLGQSDERLPHFFRPKGELFLVNSPHGYDPETLTVPGFRRFANRMAGLVKQNWFHAVGRIEGMGVWIQRQSTVRTVGFIVEPKNREAMMQWFLSNQLTLIHEPDPLPADIWAEPATP
ncbi:hypothetical protein [Myxococcus stipitatus]|uniref:hypothetical protein n=1 Tax=Myxococcus stipitatus TaxID=83455 RepID=UPI0030D38F0B